MIHLPKLHSRSSIYDSIEFDKKKVSALSKSEVEMKVRRENIAITGNKIDNDERSRKWPSVSHCKSFSLPERRTEWFPVHPLIYFIRTGKKRGEEREREQERERIWDGEYVDIHTSIQLNQNERWHEKKSLDVHRSSSLPQERFGKGKILLLHQQFIIITLSVLCSEWWLVVQLDFFRSLHSLTW